jgi:DnaK suppressor protein
MSRESPDLGAVRQILEAALAECRAASTATADDRKPVELDQTTVGRLSRMDALQRQAMAQAAERQRQTRTARLTAALERLEAGDYGYCVRCGEAIAAQRLAIDPAAPTCIGCAKRC